MSIEDHRGPPPSKGALAWWESLGISLALVAGCVWLLAMLVNDETPPWLETTKDIQHGPQSPLEQRPTMTPPGDAGIIVLTTAPSAPTATASLTAAPVRPRPSPRSSPTPTSTPPMPTTTMVAVQIVTPTPALLTHTVAFGETLAIIATQYGTSVDAIVVLNGISNQDQIVAGQQLLIPIEP